MYKYEIWSDKYMYVQSVVESLAILDPKKYQNYWA